MAYVTVPKDLTQVKSKVLFNLTKRQPLCFGAALLMGVPLFFCSGQHRHDHGGALHDTRHASGLPVRAV